MLLTYHFVLKVNTNSWYICSIYYRDANSLFAWM